MKRTVSMCMALCILSLCLMTSCGKDTSQEITDRRGDEQTKQTDAEQTETETIAATVDEKMTEIPADLEDAVNTLSISCSEGTADCWAFDGQTLTFSGLDADTVCSLSGEFDGQIVVDAGEDYKLELELCGVTLFSSAVNPMEILSGKRVTVTAKKDSENAVYDRRDTVTDEEVHAAAIYAACDLTVGGKGSLTVISQNNNGIHTKDDLRVQNLTLSVTCADNALKGNDGVEILSGTVTLIAKAGDGIKTTNTDVSSKGNQRGTVTLTGGDVTVYAACDGIDAAYDADIGEQVNLTIVTDRYSPYSESVETSDTDGDLRYIRFTSNQYSFSVKYYNDDSDWTWVNATYCKSISGGRSTYYYYSLEKKTEYRSVQFFIYSAGQEQGQEEEYAAKSDIMTWNSAYDTFALEARNNSLSYNWTNYSSGVSDGWGGPGGMGGGMGGMQDGNTEKGDYSTKGIKAGNEIRVSGGNVNVQSYDDAIHAGSDDTLENGETPTGNVIVSGGSLTLFSKDDGIHADGTLTVQDGKINITGSYEGLEGLHVVVSGGEISAVSSDDGINATATTGTGITFEGGKTYLYAGGDGVDANSRTSYQGIVFAGGELVVISTSSMNSSIDTEQGYTYTGGTVLAVCPSNGMGSESTNCQNFSSVGTKKTLNLSAGQILRVSVGGTLTVSAEMPCGLSALVIYLGSSGATIEAGNSTSY